MDIEKLKQTCRLCPSQWDAWTDDGRYMYIRHRHGYLSVETADTEEDYIPDKELVFSEHINENSYLSTVDMLEFLHKFDIKFKHKTKKAYMEEEIEEVIKGTSKLEPRGIL